MSRITNSKKERQIFDLGKYQDLLNDRIRSWNGQDFQKRFWSKDPTIWFPKEMSEISNRLGWLDLPELMVEYLDEIADFAKAIKSEGFKHVVLLGMGGSSLASEVFQKVFDNAPGYPELIVLDSTHPDQVKFIENRVNLQDTIFIVASKSGTTLETISLYRYFWQKMFNLTTNPGKHFIAITDSETSLVQLARERGFRHIFTANPDVGGRYSALSHFGIVPAALIGVDINGVLEKTKMEIDEIKKPSGQDPGLMLGAAIGEMAKKNRNKLTIFASPSFQDFPIWIEQLVAESTGKDGKGIIPIVNEPPSPVEIYSEDRVFCYILFDGDDNDELIKHMKEVKNAGHPVISIHIFDKMDIGQEFFRWEVAVASAGAVLGIHPFNQPDVELSKTLAKQLMGKKDMTKTPSEEEESSLNLQKVESALKQLLDKVERGNYIAIQAYLAASEETTANLQKLRLELLKKKKIATTTGYGPRFLHSTGQLHKGGPNIGLFIQIVDEPENQLTVPETNYSFNEVIRAQALGDFAALQRRERRVIRIDLHKQRKEGLKQLTEMVKRI